MKRFRSLLAAASLVAAPPAPLSAQEITLIVGGDIEWSRADIILGLHPHVPRGVEA